MDAKAQSARILVVDDTPSYLDILRIMLGERGYAVLTAPSGALALDAASRYTPDLILLDILMPDMDGFSVCARLKADEALKDIPVIFISGLGDTEHIVRGFACGGADYIVKPFRFVEMGARIETHLALRRQKHALNEAYHRLRALDEMRNNFMHMVVHDMGGFITSLTGFMELALLSASEMEKNQSIAVALEIAEDIKRLLHDLLDVGKMEAGHMPVNRVDVELIGLVRQVAAKTNALTGKRRLSIDHCSETLSIRCDPLLIFRVVQNLLLNAVKHTRAETGNIRISIRPDEAAVRVAIRDNGVSIPREHHEKIFEKFISMTNPMQKHFHSAGMGLHFCKMVVEAHGGAMGLQNALDVGNVFWFTLPTR